MSRKLRPTTVLTLTGRAQIVCDSDDSLTDVTKHLNTVFIENYSRDFIESNTYIRSNDSSNNSYTTRATIPYIGGTSETIAEHAYYDLTTSKLDTNPVQFTTLTH